MEQETAQDAPDLEPDIAHRHIVQCLEDRAVGIQFLVLVLGVIADFDHVAGLQPARLRGDFPHQQLHHGGFALAVFADKGHFLLVFHHHVKVLQNRFARFVGKTEVVGLKHHAVAFGGGREEEMDVRGVQLVHLHHLHLFQQLHAALHLLGLGRLVAEPLDEGLDVADLLLLVLIHLLLVGDALLAPLHVGVVVAFVVLQVAEGDLQGAAADVVQETAVVRYEHQAAPVVLQEGLQPLDGNDVKVVGRFVQQDDFGAPQQDFGQFHTHLPAAAELADRPVEIVGGEAQPQQHLLHVRFDVGGAEVLPPLLQFVDALDEFGVCFGMVVVALRQFGGQLLHPAVGLTDFVKGFVGLFPDGFVALDFQLLRQVADPEPFGDDHFAALR